MIDAVDRVVRFVSKLLMVCSMLAIGAMATLVAASAIVRYLFGYALSFTGDIASSLLISCIFFALPYAAVEGKHIRTTLISSKLPLRGNHFCELITYLVAGFYLAILTKLSLDYTLTGYILDSHSETAHLYQVPWRAAVFISTTWFTVVVFIFCLKRVMGIVRFTKGKPLLSGNTNGEESC